MSRCSRLHRRHLEQESVRNLWPPQVHASVEVHLWQLQRGFGSAHAFVWHTSVRHLWCLPCCDGSCGGGTSRDYSRASVGAPCGARGVRAQPRMHLSGLAESWHDLARERGGDGERGKGPSRPPRARPRPTTYLCLEPIGRSICPVACCVLRDERRVRGPRG